MDAWTVLLELSAMLLAALLIGLIFERMKLNALTGFLLAGIIIGPQVLNIVSSGELVATLAELGVSLLLFAIGLEFSIRHLRSLGLATLVTGLLQISLTVVLVMGGAMVLGFSFPIALTLGLIVAPSSTAVALRVMKEDDAIDAPHGRITLGVLLLQDAAIVPLVLIVSTLGSGGSFPDMALGFGKAIGITTLLFLAFWLIIRYILPLLLDSAAISGNRDLFIMVSAVVFLFTVWITHYFKISPALGAFVAGVLLAESDFAAQIRADVSSLRALFVTFFFISVGMLTNIRYEVGYISGVVALLLVLLVAKTLLITLILLLARKPVRTSLATGLSLGMIGEFSFLLLEVAGKSNLLPPEIASQFLSATILSLLISPFLVKYGPWLGKQAEYLLVSLGWIQPAPAVKAAIPDRGHFLVIGLGPSGMMTTDMLRHEGANVLAIDINRELVRAARKNGVNSMVGDANHPEVLEHAHAGDAAAIVITIPDRSAVLNIIKQVRSSCPDTPVIARSRWNRFSQEIHSAGASITIEEETETGRSLGREALKYY
jgi:CPA2 family monovalent cation:H+ antiporter-2